MYVPPTLEVLQQRLEGKRAEAITLTQDMLTQLDTKQKRDRSHPTLAVAFTTDQLADLHTRERYATEQWINAYIPWSVSNWASCYNRGKQNGDPHLIPVDDKLHTALETEMAEYKNEIHAIRGHITKARHALDPKAIKPPKRPAGTPNQRERQHEGFEHDR